MSLGLRISNWPLTAKMAALFVLAALVPLGVETVVDTGEEAARMNASAEALLTARTDQLVGELDAFNRGYQASVATLARLPAIQAFCAAFPQDSSPAKATVLPVLQAHQSGDANVRGVGLLDRTGTVTLAIEEPLTGKNLSSLEHVQTALRGSPVVSDIHISPPEVGDVPTVAYLAPVTGSGGQSGVAVLWIRAEALWSVARASNELAGPGSFAVVFDQHGIRVGHTFSRDIVFHPGGQLSAETIEAMAAERRFGDNTRQLLQDVRAFPEQFDRARSANPDRRMFTGFAPVNQKHNYGVTRRFETAPWTVFYMVPVDVVAGQIAAMTRSKLLFAGLILLISLTTGIVFARITVRPIRSLAGVTDAITGGNLAARFPGTRGDEIGRLGSSLNLMAERIQSQSAELQKARADLEARVQERTAAFTETTHALEGEVAQRRRAEEALRSSQALLQEIIDNSTAIISVKDLDGGFLLINRRFEELFHVRRDAIRGKTDYDVFPREYADAFRTVDAQALAHGGALQIDEVVPHDDGPHNYIVIKCVLRNHAGESYAICSMSTDITERTLAAERLRDSEQRNRAMIETALDGIIAMNHEGLIVEFNPAAEKKFGYRRSEVIGRPLADVIIPEVLREAHRTGFARYLTTGEHVVLGKRIEVEGLRADGSIIPLELSITRMPGSGLPMFTGFVRDITERRRAEEALRDSEERLATTLDSIGDAVIATDTEGRVVRMNPIAERLIGWSSKDAGGRPLSDVLCILDEDTRLPIENPVARVLREGAIVDVTGRTILISRDGAERPIAETSAPIRDRTGHLAGVVLVFRDQTEARRLAEIRARSVQLESENMRIQEASRLKSEFLANMSHELRTPLNAILGFTELIHDGRVPPDTPQYQEFLGDILTSGQHLLQLINDVLDLSKVEAGRLAFYPEPVNLDEIVGEVLGILRTASASKAIQVERRIDPELKEVVLDAARLKQVLYNFVSNALKFTPRDGRVVVRASVEPAAAAFRLEVEDTGIGIASEDIARLFVEFQQLEAGYAMRPAGGTGLGLALTRRLVEAQGGTVGVRSTVGKGSTFHAVLPRRATSGTALPPPRSFPGTTPTASRILVVEDGERDQAILIRVLTEAGYAVQTVATGAQALARCEEQPFDAITLDLILPDISGIDVMRSIRRGSLNANAPVIIVTAVTEAGAVAAFGVHDILSKPLAADALLASLTRAGVTARGRGRVLVVDDDPASLKLMAETLGQLGFEGDFTADGESGLRAAEKARPLAVVLDLMMPEMDGFAFLDRFHQLAHCRGVPVIIWTMKALTTEECDRIRSSAEGLVAKGVYGQSAIVEELRALLLKN